MFGRFYEFFVVASLGEKVVGLFFENLAFFVEFVGAMSVKKGVQSGDAGFESKAERFWASERISDVFVGAILK